jgi:hypothetical protein
MNAAVLTPSDLSTRIGASWARYLERSRRPATPHGYVYASAYRVCERRMVLEMTRPDAQPPFPADVLAKFRRGEDRERDLLSDLARIGRDADPEFDLIGQQERFELKDHKGRIAIVGKVDARLAFDRNNTAPLEVKSWSPQMVDRIETFADLFENPWTKPGAFQLLTYLYGAGVPYGFLLLDRSGLPRLLPVELEPNLDRMEDFLSRAERAIDHQREGTLPDFYTEDVQECRRCPFYGSVCNPPIGSMGAQVLTDPELEAALVRREELKSAGDEYNALDREIKDRLRGVESGIAGGFRIEGKWGKQSRIELPADLKKQYTVTDPKGRFTLTITRIN